MSEPFRVARIAGSEQISPRLWRRYFIYKENHAMADGRVVGTAHFWASGEAYNADPKDLVALSPETEAAAWYLYTVRTSDWSPDVEPLRQAARQFSAAFENLFSRMHKWRPRLRAAKALASPNEAALAMLLPDEKRTREHLAVLYGLGQQVVAHAGNLRRAEEDYFGVR